MNVMVTAALALAVMVVPGVRAADPFQDPLIRDIQALHQKAEQGDKQATRELVEQLEGLHKEKPNHTLLQAYLGSAYTLASRDAFPGPKKLEYLKNGLKTMDQAVDAAPKDIPTRFIRAVNNFNLPSFINRRDNARADFEVLLAQIKENPAEMDPLTNQAIHYFAGLSFKQLRRSAEARKAWNEGLPLAPDSEISIKIADELKKMRP